jgi:predicted dehydrogenase
MGMRHLRGYAALERAGVGEARLLVVADVDEARAFGAARKFAADTGRQIELRKGLRGVLEHDEVEAVDLVIPTGRHHLDVVEALEAGRHVLVEKPFGITMRACELMHEAASRTGLTLAVAENYRRISSNRALHALITGGVIGQPYVVSVHTIQRTQARIGREWFFDRREVGSLPLLELAVHEADLLRHVIGDVDEVYTMSAGFESEEDAGSAVLRFAGGALGQLLVLTAGHGDSSGGRLVAGSKGLVTSARWEGWERGELVVDGAESLPSERWIENWLAGGLEPDGTWDTENLEVDIQDPLRYGIATEIYDFAESVVSRRPPEVGAEDGTAAVAICLAMLESTAANAPVKVADVTSGRVRRWQREVDLELGLGDRP